MAIYQSMEEGGISGVLTAKPSVRAELMMRGVPGAELFPDEEVETYSIEGERFDITLKRELRIPVDKSLQVLIARQVSGNLVQDGIEDLSGVSAIKKLPFCSVSAAILGIRLVGDRLVVTTDNKLLPRVELDADGILAGPCASV